MPPPSKESLAGRFLRALVKKGGTGLIFLTPEDLKDDSLGNDIQFTQGPDGWVCRVVGPKGGQAIGHALDSRLKANIEALNRATKGSQRPQAGVDEVQDLLGSVKRLAGQEAGLVAAEVAESQRQIDEAVAHIDQVAQQTKMAGADV